MLVTLLEAARIAGVSKGAVRKAANAGKLTPSRDEQGRWRVHVADVERLWQRAPGSGDQRAPVSAGDQSPVIEAAELRVRLEAAERQIADRDAQIADLRRRLDTEAEERRALTLRLLEDRRPRRRRWWPFGRQDEGENR